MGLFCAEHARVEPRALDSRGADACWGCMLKLCVADALKGDLRADGRVPDVSLEMLRSHAGCRTG
eukprot:2800793-Alexandrium_andersonii.AAC.1